MNQGVPAVILGLYVLMYIFNAVNVPGAPVTFKVFHWIPNKNIFEFVLMCQVINSVISKVRCLRLKTSVYFKWHYSQYCIHTQKNGYGHKTNG